MSKGDRNKEVVPLNTYVITYTEDSKRKTKQFLQRHNLQAFIKLKGPTIIDIVIHEYKLTDSYTANEYTVIP